MILAGRLSFSARLSHRARVRLLSSAPPPLPPSPPPVRDAGAYTLPNALTLARMLVLAPAAGHLILAGDYATAAAAVAAAGALDALDGFLARRLDQRSVLGAYLDPLADKAMLVTCALCLGQQGVLPAWLVALFVARDAGLVAGALLLRARTRPPGAALLPSAAERAEADAADAAEARAEAEAEAEAAPARGGADGLGFAVEAPPVPGKDLVAAAAVALAAARLRQRPLRRAWDVVPSRISKLNTALQFLVVSCGLTSAAFALPPPPRAEDAAFLRWAWRGGEPADAAPAGNAVPAVVAAGDAGGAQAAGDAPQLLPPGLSAEPSRLVLPMLVVAVGATTLASGADYFVKAVRVFSRFR